MVTREQNRIVFYTARGEVPLVDFKVYPDVQVFIRRWGAHERDIHISVVKPDLVTRLDIVTNETDFWTDFWRPELLLEQVAAFLEDVPKATARNYWEWWQTLGWDE